jgi:U2 small nuclear ribonucleoprotein B''
MDDSTGVTVVDEPSQSVYVANLNMKIKKGAMKKALYALFTAHGRIVSIALQRTEHLLGQAWVTFADIPSAAAAKRQLQGFPLYDRPLVRVLKEIV